MTRHSLDERTIKLKNFFDTEELLRTKPSSFLIQEYYRINKIPYSIFHTHTDFVHMGISRNGIYHEEDLLGQVKVVEQYISESNAHRILELATGRGANSVYLAQRHPGIIFEGIDFSSGQLDYAFKESKKLKNYLPQKRDYHDLSCFSDNSFEIVFVIEALCYSEDKQKVINEVKRVLKPGGFFILFDGYRVDDIKKRPASTQMAYELMSLGMAVKDFESYESIENYILNSGLKIVKKENLSKNILPTLRRFEKLAIKFLNHPFFARIIKPFLPKEILNNVVSGYLMPELVEEGISLYMMTICRKE